MSTTTDLRPALLTTYKYVVTNWAVTAAEVAAGTEQDAKEVTNLLKRLAGAGLLDSTHVNGEKSLTWQSYFDVNNEPNVSRRSTVAFNRAFPKDQPVSAAPARNGVTGPRYTEEQLVDAEQMRAAGRELQGHRRGVGDQGHGVPLRPSSRRGRRSGSRRPSPPGSHAPRRRLRVA